MATKTTHRDLHILQLIAASDHSLSVKDMAEALSIPVSATYRHLALLVRSGLVCETDETGRYSAGPLAFGLSRQFERLQPWMVMAKQEIRRLAEVTGETIGLMVATHHQIMCVEMMKMEYGKPKQVSEKLGVRPSALRGAAAKTLMAFMPPAQREVMLGKDYAHLKSEWVPQWEAIRKQGFGRSLGEVVPGDVCTSVPIVLPNGRLLGALTLKVPEERSKHREDEKIARVLRAAKGFC